MSLIQPPPFTTDAAQRTKRPSVTDQIKAYIIERRLKPGDPLPTETELCEALDVSRSSLREAIRTLSALDIVEVRHGHGTYVGRLSLSALVEGLAFRGLLSPDDDFALLSDLIDVRSALEVAMAEQVIEALDATGDAELERLVQGMEDKAAADEEFLAEDRAFHAKLMEPLNNALILQLVVAFWDVYSAVEPYMQLPSRPAQVESVEAHRRILDAARTGDATAFRAAVVDHYAPVRARIAAARAQRATDTEPNPPSH